ncbi:transposase [Streptomyces sp. NPDC047043]|uniref:IS110 family transposase n=1 Tax=Streptomyces sp. NPDC047043 TaxID=3154497 RepID=UPI0033E0E740
MFPYRRVKTDERDAADLADLLRMGRLAEAWIAPQGVREVRELVRYRHRLPGARTSAKAQIQGICGWPATSFGVGDRTNDRVDPSLTCHWLDGSDRGFTS